MPIHMLGRHRVLMTARTCSPEPPASPPPWSTPTKSHLDGRASRSHHIALHQRRRNGGLAMDSDAASFIGNIPEHYDSGLGPMIFVDYAADIARRAAACSPAHVLETAAGTGIVTRQLRDFLPPGVHLTATDLNAPMLEVAQTKFRPGEEVAFQPADAAALPFSDGAFDAVVLPVWRNVFPAERHILSRGSSRARPRRTLPVQCLGLTPVQPVRPNCA